MGKFGKTERDVPVLEEGRLTFIDAVTYRRLNKRYEKLLRYCHRQLHRDVPMASCALCEHLRKGFEE